MFEDIFPVLETKRLLLRELKIDDKERVLEFRSNPIIMHFIPRPLAKNEEDAIAHINKIRNGFRNKENINWGIENKETKQLIGIAGFVRTQASNFRAEIGYLLDIKSHGKGYMTESMEAMIKYGFEKMNLHSIEAIVDPENKASQAVLERSGFEKDGYFKENFFHNGKFLDTIHYSLLTNL
ncbi:MAG: GNAT family N-acetyltransferase [Bacteroidia bacterium]